MYYKILSVCLTLQFEFKKKKFILASDVCNLLQNMIEDLELNNKDQDLGNLGMCIVRSEVIFI